MSDSNLKVLEATSGGTAVGAIKVTDTTSTVVQVSKVHPVDANGNALGVTGNPQLVTVGQSALPAGAATDTLVQSVVTSLGTDGAGEVPAAGSGVRGWLRSIFDRLAAGVGRTWTLDSSTDQVAVSGNVGVSGAVTANQGAAGASAWPVSATQNGSWNVNASQQGTWNVNATMTPAAGTSGTGAGSPNYDQQVMNGAVVAPANPLPAQLSQGNAPASAANPVPVQLSVGNAPVSAANGLPVETSYGYTANYTVAMTWTNSSTAVGAVPFAIFNPTGGTRTAYIKRIRVSTASGATTAATQLALGIYLISAAAPAGGTAIVAANKRGGSSVAPSMSSSQFLAAGLTMTGVTKGAAIGMHNSGRAQGIPAQTVWDWENTDETQCPTLPPGYGLALYYIAAGLATDFLSVEVEWAER